jgi:hypothetical protein
MIRRSFLALLFAPLASALFGESCSPKEEYVPTTEAEWNPFVEKGNLYARELQRNHIDYGAWRDVVKAWRRMTKT